MKSTVADVMTPNPITVLAETPFKKLASVMSAHRISALPVVNASAQVLGVVSEADLLLKEIGESLPGWSGLHRNRERAKAWGLVAADLMTSPAVTIAPHARLAEAARLMHDRRVKRLPVVDGDARVIGIVTRGDLLAVFMRPDQEIRHEIIDEVVTRTLWMDPTSLLVNVVGGVVSLSGEVDRQSDIAILAGLVRGVDGVVAVKTELGFRYDDLKAAAGGAWRPLL